MIQKTKHRFSQILAGFLKLSVASTSRDEPPPNKHTDTELNVDCPLFVRPVVI